MEKVSIIVPVFNMGNSLTNCIESLLKQTYSNIEIIIIDDGSTDKTFEICQRYKQISNTVKSWHTENRGSGPARNFGIDKASGEFVYFMDADDILEPNAISQLVETITNQLSDLVVFGYKKADSKGKIITIKKYETETYSGDYIRNNYEHFFDVNFKRGIQGPPWNKFFDLKLIQRKNIRYPSLKRHQDEVFISRYMCEAKKISFINNILYTHFINDISAKEAKFPVSYIEIVKELYNHRLETVAKWNENNKKVLGLIYIEYIYNSIKAFDIIFSKKAKMSKQQRVNWIKKEIRQIPIRKGLVKLPGYNSRVKLKQIKIFLYFLEQRNYKALYFMLKTRVLLETKFSWIMQLLKKNMVANLRKG